jgi:PBP1b-binding outer membrane lipoprotein LpoB
MKKIKKLYYILIIFVFLGNCSNVKEGFMNSKKSGTDEFLVQKKQPLTMPPNFEKLPFPNITLEENNDENQKTSSSLEKILKSQSKDTNIDQNQTQINSIESLILKEIKK